MLYEVITIGIIVGIMALYAAYPRMPIGEWETVMVEGSGCPSRKSGMTLGTVDREVCRHMVGIGGILVVLLVTGIAVSGHIGIIIGIVV